MKWRAFTLTELLSVIAIALLLAVVLSPIFARAQGIVGQPDCQQHMSQVIKGVLLYSAAHNDTLPSTDRYGFAPGWGHASGPAGADVPWTYVCQPYIRSYAVLVCPGDPVRLHDLEPLGTAPAGPEWAKAGYGRAPEAFHANLGWNYQWLTRTLGTDPNHLSWWNMRLGLIGNRAKTIAFVDTAFWRDGSGAPIGGGSFYVDAPFVASAYVMNKPGLGEDGWRCYSLGHGLPESPYCTVDGSAFGKAYAMHSNRQVVTTAFLDMHVSNMTPGGLVFGLDYTGTKARYDEFLWDTYE